MAEKNKSSAEQRKRMEYLTDLLNRASEAYYARDTEIMSNLEYDALYDELRALAEEPGLVMAGSPKLDGCIDYHPELTAEQFARFYCIAPGKKVILFAYLTSSENFSLQLARFLFLDAESDVSPGLTSCLCISFAV